MFETKRKDLLFALLLSDSSDIILQLAYMRVFIHTRLKTWPSPKLTMHLLDINIYLHIHWIWIHLHNFVFLQNCNLTGCDLQEANLRGANTKNAKFEDMITPLHMSQSVRWGRRQFYAHRWRERRIWRLLIGEKWTKSCVWISLWVWTFTFKPILYS